LNEKQCDKKTGQGVLLELLSQHKGPIPRDFDCARLLAWSVRTMSEELHPNDEARAKIQLGLDNALKLKLPEGRKVKIADELESTMNARSEFTPKTFNHAFQQLHTLLSRKASPGRR